MENQTLVTVYIPTFNRAELLKRAVQSVQNQTYQNLEIIIVDDCSTDDTHEYLEQLEKEDKRVRYFIKEKNSGACVSRNIAIENSTGKFITGLDDDDYFEEMRIQVFMENINLLDKYLFLCTKNLIKTKNGIIKNYFDRFKPKYICKEDLLSINYIGNQIFIRTDILKKYGFNPNMPIWQDLYAWYNLLNENKGKKALLLDKYNYVVDVSHDHERITQKKIENIYISYNLFCENFNLNNFQKTVLKVHMMNYFSNKKSKKSLFLSIFNSFNFYNLLYLIRRLVK